MFWLSVVLASYLSIIWLAHRSTWLSSIVSICSISISLTIIVLIRIASFIKTVLVFSLTSFKIVGGSGLLRIIPIFLFIRHWRNQILGWILQRLVVRNRGCKLCLSWNDGLLDKVTIVINHRWKLNEVLVDWVVIHTLFERTSRGWREGGIRIWHLENDAVHFLKAAKRVDWTSISLRGLKEVFSPGILSLVWILSWSASSSTTCWRVSQFSIRTLGMLLLHMSVKCGIG